MEIDTSRNDLGEMTLPAGTPVMLLYIDFDYNELLFTTLTSDGNDQKYFRLDFSGKDYPVSINGEDQNEIFAGLIFGG